MRILLTTLNSKYIHSNLAIKYLYAQVMKHEPEISKEIALREFTINNEYSYVYGEVLRGQYDIVCFSCYIWNIEQTKTLCEDLKKAQPKLMIVLGGPEVSYNSKKFLEENSWADMIIRGEGDIPFKNLIKVVFEKSFDRESFAHIGSLTYRGENLDEIFSTADYPLMDMTDVVFPYEYLDVEDDKVIYYESSRGCPYRCSYCLSSIDKNVRALPIPHVKKQMDFFLSRNVKQVKFIDRTFNYDKDRAYEIWKYLIAEDNGKTNFHFEICAETIDERHLKLIETAREGLFQFEIGIQSANKDVLKEIDRSPETDRLFANISRLIAMKNTHIHVDLIAGLPYENFESFKASFNKVYNLDADNLQLGFLKLLTGTKMYKKRDKYGIVYRSRAPYEIISNKFISALDISRLKMVENVLDLYHNRGGFSESIKFLISEEGNAFDFYDKLALFFYREGFQHKSHKKEDLYRILLKYVREKMKIGYCDRSSYDCAKNLIEQDLRNTMNFDAVKKFMRKGWEI